MQIEKHLVSAAKIALPPLKKCTFLRVRNLLVYSHGISGVALMCTKAAIDGFGHMLPQTWSFTQIVTVLRSRAAGENFGFLIQIQV